jgi:hypothetical protein
MKPIHNFIISPVGDEYVNTVNINGVDIVKNTSFENHKNVNRFGIVKALPSNYNGNIEVGDTVIVHHNVFRTYYDMKGRPKKSSEFFKDDEYLVNEYKVYAYKKPDSEWIGNNHYCFIKPVENEYVLIDERKKEKQHIGYVFIAGDCFKEVKNGDLIGFKKNSEYEFFINNQRLYRMKLSDIVLKFN